MADTTLQVTAEGEPLAVNYSLERVDPNESLIEALESTGEIRMRLQPQLLIKRGPKGRRSMYCAWRSVWWNLNFPDLSTGYAFREALASFMRLLEFTPATEIQGLLDKEARRLAELQTLKATPTE